MDGVGLEIHLKRVKYWEYYCIQWCISFTCSLGLEDWIKLKCSIKFTQNYWEIKVLFFYGEFFFKFKIIYILMTTLTTVEYFLTFWYLSLLELSLFVLREFDLTQNMLAFLTIQLFSSIGKCAVKLVHYCVNVNNAWTLGLKLI